MVYRIGDYVGVQRDDPLFGVVETADFGYMVRTAEGELTGPWFQCDMWRDISAHVNYPHYPGTLHDCPACEASGELETD